MIFQIINEPYYYLVSHSGKDFRKQVLLACNAWLHVDIEFIDIIERSIAMLHNVSLL
jgi:geranylgeranyl pyrophosphate synthase